MLTEQRAMLWHSQKGEGYVSSILGISRHIKRRYISRCLIQCPDNRYYRAPV